MFQEGKIVLTGTPGSPFGPGFPSFPVAPYFPCNITITCRLRRENIRISNAVVDSNGQIKILSESETDAKSSRCVIRASSQSDIARQMASLQLYFTKLPSQYICIYKRWSW